MSTSKMYQQTREQLFKKNKIAFLSKKVSTEGPVKNVHYLELGAGKPLILIHGGGSHSSEWYNILKPLAEKFHLFVLDRPGCGLTDNVNYDGVDFRASAIDFVASFMDAIGLEKAFFLAQSMGGYFAITFAMQFPERVEKLVLIGAPAGMNLWIPLMLRLLGTKWLNRFLVKTVARPSINNLKTVHQQLLVSDVKKISKDYLEHGYYGQLIPGNEQGFLTLLENALTFRGWRKELYIGDQLGRLKMPVRFIWGDKDAFEKPESGKPKTSTIGDCQFEVVENAGHCPWLDQPEKCVALIIAMLND